MNSHFFDTFKLALENPLMTEEKAKTMLDSADFFFKVLRVKFESQDQEMQKQAIEEIKEFKNLLEAHSKKLKITHQI
jgi:hypothetical protein